MFLKKGSCRITVLSNPIIKLPIIRILKAIECLKSENKAIRKIFLSGGINSVFLTIKRCLLRGWVHNFNEFLFFIKYRNIFMMPTYFSLFGLLNIQQKGFPIKKDEKEFKIIIDSITKEDSHKSSHQLRNINNYCINRNRRVRIIDYGDPNGISVILKYGKELEIALSNYVNKEI